uniref:Uncharacterized protein n=1 Tax=Ditylenchus dipsaci TaxID=166011 RepID=A0A915DAE2_9BILA
MVVQQMMVKKTDLDWSWLCPESSTTGVVDEEVDVKEENLHDCLSPGRVKSLANATADGPFHAAVKTSLNSSWEQWRMELCPESSTTGVVDEEVEQNEEHLQDCLFPDQAKASVRGCRAYNLLENNSKCSVESLQDVGGTLMKSLDEALCENNVLNLQSSQTDFINAVMLTRLPAKQKKKENKKGWLRICQHQSVLAGHLVHVAPDSISATDSRVIEAMDYFLQRLTFYEKIYGMGPLPVDYERLLPNVLLEVKEKFCNRYTSLIHFAESERVCNAMLQGEAWWTNFLTWLESYVSFNDLVLQARQYWREVATKEQESKDQQVVRPASSCAAPRFSDDFLAAVDPYPRSKAVFSSNKAHKPSHSSSIPLLPAAMDKQIKEKVEADAINRRAWSRKEEERWSKMKSKAEPTHGYQQPEKAVQEGYSSGSWRKEEADDDYQKKMRRDEEYYKDQKEKDNLYWENRAREKEEREEEERCRVRRLEEVEARQKEEREREDVAREIEAREEEQRIREQSIRDDESVFYAHDPNNNSGKM